MQPDIAKHTKNCVASTRLVAEYTEPLALNLIGIMWQ